MMTLAYSPNIISARELGFQHDDRPLFANINFTLVEGEMLFIMGRNGSGKSTLMRLLTGLGDITKGNIFWNNSSITDDLQYHTHLHYLGHQMGLKSGLTVQENIQLLLLLHRVTMPPDINEIISALALTPLMYCNIRQLSAGQQKKVALLKLALIAKPLWLLDEPFTSLDKATQQWLERAIDKHRQQGGIVITSSHQPFKCITQPCFTLMMDSE